MATTSLFRQLTEKPWESPPGGLQPRHAGPSFALPAATVGLRVFLCVVSVIFLLLLVAHSERMLYEDWRPVPRQWLLWLNSLALVSSSAAFEWAAAGARRGRLDETRAAHALAGGFALLFLLGQLWAWRQLGALVPFDVAGPAIGFFYLITGLHGLHLLGGLVAWGLVGTALWRRPDQRRAAAGMRLCATYWHYLLALWLLLFWLLFSGNDHLSVLLAICGLR